MQPWGRLHRRKPCGPAQGRGLGRATLASHGPAEERWKRHPTPGSPEQRDLYPTRSDPSWTTNPIKLEMRSTGSACAHLAGAVVVLAVTVVLLAVVLVMVVLVVAVMVVVVVMVVVAVMVLVVVAVVVVMVLVVAVMVVMVLVVAAMVLVAVAVTVVVVAMMVLVVGELFWCPGSKAQFAAWLSPRGWLRGLCDGTGRFPASRGWRPDGEGWIRVFKASAERTKVLTAGTRAAGEGSESPGAGAIIGSLVSVEGL